MMGIDFKTTLIALFLATFLFACKSEQKNNQQNNQENEGELIENTNSENQEEIEQEEERNEQQEVIPGQRCFVFNKDSKACSLYLNFMEDGAFEGSVTCADKSGGYKESIPRIIKGTQSGNNLSLTLTVDGNTVQETWRIVDIEIIDGDGQTFSEIECH